ncbi:MAG: hypothetical protein O7G88_17200 [bacterium]|nr:hypothetical protein [bacterium]
MALSKELLDILACPETKQPLTLAEAALVERLNERIGQGQLTNRGGEQVTEPIDGGLIREDGQYLYPIRDDIPVMLIDESVAL